MKLLEDDDKLKLEEALKHALWARNVEVTRLGETPQHILYGCYIFLGVG